MAESLLRHRLHQAGAKSLTIFSRGLYAGQGHPMAEFARQVLRQIGISAPEHKSQNLSRDDIEKAGRIYTMTRDHLSTLLARYPDASVKAQTLASSDIADPMGGSLRDYEKCRIEIQNALEKIIS